MAACASKRVDRPDNLGPRDLVPRFPMRPEPETNTPSGGPVGGALGRSWLLGLGLFALLIRVLSLFIAVQVSPYWGGFVVDDRAYHEWAVRLAGGEDPGGVFFLSPLLSHLLGQLYAFVGERPVAWLGIQAVLGAFTTAAVAAVGSRAFGPRAGVLAGLLLALYGPLVFITEGVLTETLHLALVWAAIWAWPASTERCTGRIFGVGLLSGLAVLARNYFIVALPLWALVMARRGRTSLLAFLAGAVAGLAPATIHNLAEGELVLVTSSGGVNLWLGNHPGATGRLHLPPGMKIEQIQDPSTMASSTRELARLETGEELSASGTSAHFRRKAVDWALGHPLPFLRLVVTRLGMTLEAFEHPGERNYYQAARLSPLLRWTPSRWPLVLALAAVGVLGLRSVRLTSLAPVLSAAMAALTALLLFWVSDRFRLPLVPPLVVLAGGGLDLLLRERGRLRVQGVVLAIAVAATSLGLSAGRERETYMSHYNLGLQYRRVGQHPMAEAEARRAMELAPDYLRAHQLLVESLRAQDRLEEAVEASKVLRRLAREQGLEVQAIPRNGR